ncbi:hypothetical protein [Streptomyces sp. VNUA24]|nr:hypothetical protein [Streptomyces sp. VNUA24]WEH12598.1 hypothetical protein PYR72_02335 [Streptomyces sp. VNUA24]
MKAAVVGTLHAPLAVRAPRPSSSDADCPDEMPRGRVGDRIVCDLDAGR